MAIETSGFPRGSCQDGRFRHRGKRYTINSVGRRALSLLRDVDCGEEFGSARVLLAQRERIHKVLAYPAPVLVCYLVDKSGNPRLIRFALWLLGKIKGKGLNYVDIASRDEDKNIRIVALRLARQLEDVDVLPVVARLADDPSPAVRRECAIAIRHNKADEAAQLWAQLASHHDGSDRSERDVCNAGGKDCRCEKPGREFGHVCSQLGIRTW